MQKEETDEYLDVLEYSMRVRQHVKGLSIFFRRAKRQRGDSVEGVGFTSMFPSENTPTKKAKTGVSLFGASVCSFEVDTSRSRGDLSTNLCFKSQSKWKQKLSHSR